MDYDLRFFDVIDSRLWRLFSVEEYQALKGSATAYLTLLYHEGLFHEVYLCRGRG
jgi:hypothetical protein